MSSSSEPASGAALEKSSPTGRHPPVARLLTFYHRTLEEAESRAILLHLKDCPACQARLRRIEATVSLFRRTDGWRRQCPSTMALFHHASFELPDTDTREIQSHLPACYACREEVLVFRDVRQATRVGHSPFLAPRNFQLQKAYWQRRGYWRWFFQPHWRRHRRRLMWLGLALLSIGLLHQTVMLELERRQKSRSSSSGLPTWILNEKGSAAKARDEAQPAPLTLPTGRRDLYYYRYDETGMLQTLTAQNASAQWARYQVQSPEIDPEVFRPGEPLGSEGLIVLKPRSPLSPQQLAQIEALLRSALTGNARHVPQAWGATRATLQQLTGGEVWRLIEPRDYDTPSPHGSGNESPPAR